MDRKIPNIMGTQHPDNVRAPFFQKSPFVSAFKEINEAYQNYSVLGADEYMWDWEGKHADASVISRLYSEHYDYFKHHQLGLDKFLTFRFPNIWEEKGYSLMQAMTTMLLAEDLARDLQFDQRPLFEAILPMTKSADQLINMEDKFSALAHFKSKVFKNGHKDYDTIKMIPLFESFEAQQNAPKTLEKFVDLYHKHFGKDVNYMRVFLASSDSALSNGFLNSIIGNKLALSGLAQFVDKTRIPIYPIAGTGSTIFRGGLSPEMIDRYIREFPGLKTATIQSAFRYDFPMATVKAAIKKLRRGLQNSQFNVINDEDHKTLLNIANRTGKEYHDTLDPLINDLQHVFDAFPRRRDRHLHVGILGYSRNVDGYKMPRAITFSGSLYSIGVPPEFIGSGKVLRGLNQKEMKTLRKYYPDMRHDFEHAGKYFSRRALNILEKQNSAWKVVDREINDLEDILDVKFGPTNDDESKHAQLAADLVSIHDSETQTELINRMGLLRHFLG